MTSALPPSRQPAPRRQVADFTIITARTRHRREGAARRGRPRCKIVEVPIVRVQGHHGRRFQDVDGVTKGEFRPPSEYRFRKTGIVFAADAVAVETVLEPGRTSGQGRRQKRRRQRRSSAVLRRHRPVLQVGLSFRHDRRGRGAVAAAPSPPSRSSSLVPSRARSSDECRRSPQRTRDRTHISG